MSADERVREWWPRAGGIVVTLVALVLVEALSRWESPFVSRGTAMVPAVLAVVYAGFLGGLRSSLPCAAVVVAFAAYFFSTPGALFTYDDRNLRRLVTYGVAVPLVALLVGGLKMRHERAAQRVIEKEREFAAALARKNEQLAAAIDDMDEANRELAEANATLEAFSYVVAHDLKEPVRAIEAYSRAIEEDHAPELPPDVLDLVRRNRETSERLQRLLRGLLDYSRASRILPADLKSLRVEDILRHPDCVTRFGNVLEERHARLNVAPGPAVRASLGALCIALGNVVLNALKHNPRPEPFVRVRARPWAEDPRMVEVVVEDNGPGFPQAVRERFSEARRGMPQTVKGGFGLTIARDAVEKMGGRMWLGRSEEGGASVHMLLRGVASPEAPGASDEPSRVSPAGEVGNRP